MEKDKELEEQLKVIDENVKLSDEIEEQVEKLDSTISNDPLEAASGGGQKTKPLKKEQFQKYIFKKDVKKKFVTFGRKCKIKADNKTTKDYKISCIKINRCLGDNLMRDATYESTSIYTLLSILDSHFLLMTDISNRVKDLPKGSKLLKDAHEFLIKKQYDLLEILQSNIRTPIKYDEFMDIVHKQRENHNPNKIKEIKHIDSDKKNQLN